MVRNWVNSKVKFNCNLIFIYIFHCFHISFDKFSGPVRIISDLYFLLAYGLLGTRKLKQQNPRIWYSQEEPCNDSKYQIMEELTLGFYNANLPIQNKNLKYKRYSQFFCFFQSYFLSIFNICITLMLECDTPACTSENQFSDRFYKVNFLMSLIYSVFFEFSYHVLHVAVFLRETHLSLKEK